jgi:hypothetical protein
MKRYLLFVLTAFLVFFHTGCCKKGNPIIPPDEQPKPGRRDYTWTVDTLKVTNGDLFYMFSLWGISPTDIWAVGSGSSSAVTLWHYDGASWSKNSSQLSSNLMCVYGFAQNDVYACDAPGRGVYHYNGQQWSNVYTYSGSGTYLGLNNIWGDAQNNIFAVGSIDTVGTGGYVGAILHFNGSTWNFISIPNYRVGFTWIRRGVYESTKYYMSAVRFESTGDTNKIYELDGSSLKEIYSGQEVASVCEMAGKIYFAVGKKIFKYQNNQFVLWKDFSATNHVGWICGRSEIDFFTLASDGLTHYNGTDLMTLYSTDLPISGIFVFEKDIFFILNFKIIVHGRLQ